MVRLRDLLFESPSKKDTPHGSKDTYINRNEAKKLYNQMNYTFDFEEFYKGMNVELEHKDVTKGDLIKTAKIAAAHLREVPDYYTKLKKNVETKNEDIGGVVGAAPNAPGLVAPGGYIRGAPKPKDVKKTRKLLNREKKQ